MSSAATIGIAFKVRRCPLKDAWVEAGVGDEKLATLCRIAGAFDRGLFEATGVRFANVTWTPGHGHRLLPHPPEEWGPGVDLSGLRKAAPNPPAGTFSPLRTGRSSMPATTAPPSATSTIDEIINEIKFLPVLRGEAQPLAGGLFWSAYLSMECRVGTTALAKR